MKGEYASGRSERGQHRGEKASGEEENAVRLVVERIMVQKLENPGIEQDGRETHPRHCLQGHT